MSGSREDRRVPRTEMVLKVSYDQASDLHADYLTNLGMGGLFVRTTVPFSVGEHLEFSISFPGLLEPVPLSGVVRWRRAEDHPQQGKPAGVGVEFNFADGQRRGEVERLLGISPTGESPSAVISGHDGQFRVLLVEDNPFAHQLFEHAVKRFHRQLERKPALSIVPATTGQEALSQLAEGSIDLAIVDHFLPVITGAEVIRRMRADQQLSAIPVVMISVGGDGVRETALEAGADLYLDKPVMLKELINTLQILLRLARVGEETS